MSQTGGLRPGLSAVLFLAVPYGVATQPLDPTTVRALPDHVLALGSFVVVLLAGALVRFRSEDFVDNSVSASMDRPHVSIVYGIMAYAMVVFLTGLGLTQLSRVGVLAFNAVVLGSAGVILLLAGLGYAVVGTWVTSLRTELPQPSATGLVLGATLSALVWLVLPFVASVFAWVAIAAVGIGGPVREWFHSERAVEVTRSE